MYDPIQAAKQATATMLAEATSVAPLPTVHPSRPEYQVATETGQRTLWIVFVLMLISTIIFTGLAFRTPVQKRFFHTITAFITAFAAISYFAMASGDGISLVSSSVKEANDLVPDTFRTVLRAVYWARYVDWSLTTPLLLLDLALLAGMNGANITVAIVADLVMILTGLFAAFAGDESQKWGYYAIACIAYLVIIFQLAVSGRQNALARDSKTATLFNSIAGFTLIIWTVYPVVWGIADGARKINVDAEIIAYAVLDVLAKPVFGFWLLLSHDVLDSSSLVIEGVWAYGLGKREGALRVGDDDEGA
ncbi:MAG: hypothetical protein M1838_003305 [Thelocarpon superellum]|nr:MAG: hypothetical protein M1838_003305 [Thelocarpon superellum]